MIGHSLNGYTIVAAAPSTMADHYMILGIANDERTDRYVTALVHVVQMPAPTEWWTGDYTSNRERAYASWRNRSISAEHLGDLFVLGGETFLENRVIWHHLDGTPCRDVEVSEETPGIGICDHDQRVRRVVYPTGG